LSRVLLVPEPGQLVDVRHRRYVVVEVTPSTLPRPVLHSSTLDRQHLVTLSSVEDDALGGDLQVLWEVEGQPGRYRRADSADRSAPAPRSLSRPARLVAALQAVPRGSTSSGSL
jgi:hypothetical protein